MAQNYTLEQLKDGVVLGINKPYAWSSFATVNKLKYVILKHFGIKKIKIGHAGTLDPLATGLLLICIGKATKKTEELQKQQKTYIGSFCINSTTPSYDLETNINQTFSTTHLDEKIILNTAQNMIGEQMQIPPLYSAKHVQGERAYNYARKGKTIELKANNITIYDFKITKIQIPEVHFSINCSKGTYIRSIARDFGKNLNTGGHLSSLKRTKIGNYDLSNAYSIQEFTKMLT